MSERDTIPVWVTSVSYEGGPLAYGRGETEDGGAIDFASEPRAIWAVSEALDAGDGPILIALPTWWSSACARSGRPCRPRRLASDSPPTPDGGLGRSSGRESRTPSRR